MFESLFREEVYVRFGDSMSYSYSEIELKVRVDAKNVSHLTAKYRSES